MMERQGLLDPDNEVHLFCLHAIYKPIINGMLEAFTNAWINHKMRTAANKSPLQQFIMGMQQIQHERGTIANQYFEQLSEVQANFSFSALIIYHEIIVRKCSTIIDIFFL